MSNMQDKVRITRIIQLVSLIWERNTNLSFTQLMQKIHDALMSEYPEKYHGESLNDQQLYDLSDQNLEEFLLKLNKDKRLFE